MILVFFFQKLRHIYQTHNKSQTAIKVDLGRFYTNTLFGIKLPQTSGTAGVYIYMLSTPFES